MRVERKVNSFLFILLALAVGCPKRAPKAGTCASEKDCRAGEKCVNQRCVQCAAAADCPPGHQCQEGGCRPIEGWCSADGDCPGGQVCKSNQCTACQTELECGEGGKCIDGACLRKGQCRSNDDCPEAEDCVRGVCTRSDGPTAGALPACTLAPVYFGYDLAIINEEAKPTLQANAECLSTTPRSVAVIGLTDPRGTDEYNIALSDQRARVVSDYIIRLGIDSARLRVVPKGESEAVGESEASWAKDRRTEFTWE